MLSETDENIDPKHDWKEKKQGKQKSKLNWDQKNNRVFKRNQIKIQLTL